MRLLTACTCILAILTACSEESPSASSLILYSEGGSGFVGPDHPCAWQSADFTATIETSTTNAQEGQENLLSTPLPPATNWQIRLKATAPLNLTRYGRGLLAFWIRTTNESVAVGMQSGFAAEANLQTAQLFLSNGSCGFTNDGSWCQVLMPLGQLLGANPALAFDTISAPFHLGSTCPGPVFLDDIRLVAGSTPAGGSSGGDSLEIPGWTLVWQDEFAQADGSYPSASKWSHDLGHSAPGGPAYWGNSELQYYTSTNAIVSGGILHIQARYLGTGPNTYGAYTSARIKTKGLFNFQYGKIQARIKFDRFAQGMWPAFWLLGNGWPSTPAWPECGEIDIMEIGEQGRFNAISGTAIWGDGGAQTSGGSVTGNFYDTWHVIGMDWDTEAITWHLDGVPYKVADITGVNQSELHQDFFIILNVAVGGTATGYTGGKTVDYALFPVTMLVDWVRVYTKD